jgi:hyperosmotically inducible protein
MGRLLMALVLTVGSLAACQATTGKSASQTMDDASITVDVQKKLTSDRTANFTRVDVETKQGVVQLSGIVQTSEHMARAEDLAKQVSGVRRVHNNLQVQTAQP